MPGICSLRLHRIDRVERLEVVSLVRIFLWFLENIALDVKVEVFELVTDCNKEAILDDLLYLFILQVSNESGTCILNEGFFIKYLKSSLKGLLRVHEEEKEWNLNWFEGCGPLRWHPQVFELEIRLSEKFPHLSISSDFDQVEDVHFLTDEAFK